MKTEQFELSCNDAALVNVATKEIESFLVYSEFLGDWIEVPEKKISETHRTYAQELVDKEFSPEARAEAKADFDVDQDRDDALNTIKNIFKPD